MVLGKENVYSFDNTAILNQCKLEVPKAFWFLGKKYLFRKNRDKLVALFSKLDEERTPRYRFEPVDLELLVIKFGNQLLLDEIGQTRMLPDVFREKIISQLINFINSVKEDFLVIKKDEDILYIVKMFEDNEKELKKDKNIPEKEDCEILRGLEKFDSKGEKYFVSHDEHFWAYKEIILSKLNIIVVEEWNCDKLNSPL